MLMGRIDNNLTITHQNSSDKKYRSCAFADAVVKATHSVPGLFNEIVICAIFISVNAIQNLLSHELILIIHGYDQRVSKVDLSLPGL